MEKIPPRKTITRSVRSIETELGRSSVIDMLGLEDGPTLVVVGGHHGDEPAGYAAAGILASYTQPLVGRLVVIPQASQAACEIFNRYHPHEGESDLNRCYRLEDGHRDAQCPGAMHAKAIFATVTGYKPDAVLDLHETSEGHKDCPPGVPIWSYTADESSELLAGQMGIMSVRKLIAHAFTSELTLAGYRALAIETRKSKMLGERVRAHISAVRAAATAIGVKFEIQDAAITQRIGEG